MPLRLARTSDRFRAVRRWQSALRRVILILYQTQPLTDADHDRFSARFDRLAP